MKKQCIIRLILLFKMYATSNPIKDEYMNALNKNKQVKFWVFQLLEIKNIVISDKADSDKIEINKDQLLEYLSNLVNDVEIWKQEIAQMKF